MNVAEFLPQGYVAHENRRFQFIFKSVIDSQWINCHTQNYNDGCYMFQKPLTRLDRMTVTFGNPLTPIQFDPDRSNYTITYGAVTLITTSQNHNCQTGDKVYFSDFTTITPAADSDTILKINSLEGLYMTFIALDQFTIPINTLGLAPPPAGVNMTVYFGAKRVYIPMELTYIIPP